MDICYDDKLDLNETRYCFVVHGGIFGEKDQTFIVTNDKGIYELSPEITHDEITSYSSVKACYLAKIGACGLWKNFCLYEDIYPLDSIQCKVYTILSDEPIYVGSGLNLKSQNEFLSIIQAKDFSNRKCTILKDDCKYCFTIYGGGWVHEDNKYIVTKDNNIYEILVDDIDEFLNNKENLPIKAIYLGQGDFKETFDTSEKVNLAVCDAPLCCVYDIVHDNLIYRGFGIEDEWNQWIKKIKKVSIKTNLLLDFK